MKRLLWMIYLLAVSFPAYAALDSAPSVEPEPKNVQTSPSPQKNPSRKPKMPASHRKMSAENKNNCKTCHDCEYPTNRKPCLVKCPRTESSIHHPPSEAPEVLVLDELSDRFGSVILSHRQHAQMSEMGIGCTGCHHYNTTGPVLNCKKCHEKTRKRENITVPDLVAAYHRQCMPCHQQWGHTTDCDSCHLPLGAVGAKKQREEARRLKGRRHPERVKPAKIVYETGYAKGKFVTFYHDEHTTTFKQPCVNCHKGDNCIKCHDASKKKAADGAAQTDRHLKVHKTFEQHHKACFSCHKNEGCSKCHSTREKARFNHGTATGWALKKYHARLSCRKCHEIGVHFSKPDSNCRSCHKGWKVGTFKHAITGLELSANHNGLECESCHKSGDFSKKPVCKECHNDRDYPAALPGKKVSKK